VLQYWRNRIRRDDAGISLVEMLVALVVTSIAFTALAAAILTGVRSAQTATVVTGGNQLASEQVERLRAIDWSLLGHYADEPGWGSGYYGGENLVKVAATTPSPRPVEVPYLAAQTVTIKNVAYSVTTRVTWAGSSVGTPNTGATYASKRITVTVTSNFRGQTRTSTQTALRTPNAKEMKPPSAAGATPISITASSVSPNQPLGPNGELTEELILLASTSVVAQDVTATYTLATGATATAALTPDATAKQWTIRLPVGTGPFTPGTAVFTYTATHASGSTTTATAQVQFTAYSGSFSLNNPNASTTYSQLAVDYTLAAPITVSVTTSDPATAVTGTYPLSSGSNGTLTLTGGPTNWTGSIPIGAGPITAGNLTITLSATSVGGSTATATAAVVLQAPSLGAIEIVGLTASPNLCTDNKAPFLTHRSSTLTAEVKNVSATTGTVTIKVGSATPVTATAVGAVGGSGGQLFRITVPAGYDIPTAPVTIQVVATRTADSATQTRDFPVAVSRKNSAAAC